MKCPFCEAEMIPGHIQPIGLRAPFWLPDDVELPQRSFLSTKVVESVGGRVIGRASQAAFIARTLSPTHLCPKCDFLITQL